MSCIKVNKIKLLLPLTYALQYLVGGLWHCRAIKSGKKTGNNAASARLNMQQTLYCSKAFQDKKMHFISLRTFRVKPFS